MKILLIETSRTYHGKSKGVRLSLPLGLLYMGAVLEEEGFKVSLFNNLVCPKTRVKNIPGFLHHGVDDDYFKDIVEKESPDIIGISCPFTAQFDNFVHAAKLVKEVSMAKYWCSDMQFRVADKCLQLFGGYGYMKEYPISRHWTDARLQRIYAGTNEVMKVIIAQQIGLSK